MITLPIIQQAVQKVDDHLFSGVWGYWNVGVEKREEKKKTSLQSYLCNCICLIEKTSS